MEQVSVPSLDNIKVSSIFGDYQRQVDENLYKSLSNIDSKSLVRIFGDVDTPMFNKAKECINPCMAFATTWGEAGSSYPGVSLTTVMDFNPNTYVTDIDWITVSANLEQVDSAWYICNCTDNYNSNASGNAFHMPNNLLQIPKSGSRETSAMTGLGVGPYQITSSNWGKWDLDSRVSPIYGFESSLAKCGTSWISCGINPISDLTVYAALSLGHQGGGLIDMSFGKNLINQINTQSVQDAFYETGKQMYLDACDKQMSKAISLNDINVSAYVDSLEQKVGFRFSSYTGGEGSTNKGRYVATHCLRYVFYKYYFTGGVNV